MLSLLWFAQWFWIYDISRFHEQFPVMPFLSYFSKWTTWPVNSSIKTCHSNACHRSSIAGHSVVYFLMVFFFFLSLTQSYKPDTILFYRWRTRRPERVSSFCLILSSELVADLECHCRSDCKDLAYFHLYATHLMHVGKKGKKLIESEIKFLR